MRWAILATTLLVFAGCGDDAGSDAGSTTTTSVPGTSSTTAAPTTTSSTPGEFSVEKVVAGDQHACALTLDG